MRAGRGATSSAPGVLGPAASDTSHGRCDRRAWTVAREEHGYGRSAEAAGRILTAPVRPGRLAPRMGSRKKDGGARPRTPRSLPGGKNVATAGGRATRQAAGRVAAQRAAPSGLAFMPLRVVDISIIEYATAYNRRILRGRRLAISRQARRSAGAAGGRSRSPFSQHPARTRRARRAGPVARPRPPRRAAPPCAPGRRAGEDAGACRALSTYSRYKLAGRSQ
jgi:hypothetical protein